MRKLILISAFVSASILASVSAQAGESRNLILAANEESKSVETSKSLETSKSVETSKPVESTQPSDEATAKPQASPKQASRSKTRAARRESDEQKARRIAARYGVYW